MDELERLLKHIEQLRQQLHDLSKDNLTDPEVIIASQMLDAALNEYYRLMRKKANNDSK